MPTHRRPWTDNEVEQALRLRNEGLNTIAIAQSLNRTVDSVQQKLDRISPRKPKRPHRFWTEAEVERLLCLKNEGLSSVKIARLLNRTPRAIKKKLNSINPNPKRPTSYAWSEEEIDLLLELAETMPRTQLIAFYNSAAEERGFKPRTYPAIKHQLQKLGCSCKPQVGWYLVQAIAIGLGFPRDRVDKWVKSGKLNVYKEGTHTYVRHDHLIDFLVNHPDSLDRLSPDGLRWFAALIKEDRETPRKYKFEKEKKC